MASISSIPTTRVSDLLVRERLLTQLQSEQARLLQLQTQVSTGQRFQRPSEGPVQALQGIAIRNLLQRKEQTKANLASASSYVSATETSLSNVSSLINDVRALALQSAGEGATSAERQAAVSNLDVMLDRMLQLSNQSFRGRYLFAGANTAKPAFEKQGEFVVFRGDNSRLQTFSDLTTLFDTSVTADDTFGSLSPTASASADLNPTLNDSTPLSALRGGQGISHGNIAVSDGLNTSIINLDSAVTIGDVARLLEKYPPGWDRLPPTGRTLTANVGPRGLEITLNGGSLTIGDVGNGTVATELGLRTSGGFGPGPFVGGDVNPLLLRTTRLSDVLSSRARAYLTPSGNNNDIVIEATTGGAQYNGVKVKLINDDHFQAGLGLVAGSEIAQYSPTAVAARAALVMPGPSNDLMLTATTPGESFNDVQIDIVIGGNIGNNATANYNAGTKRLTLTIDDSGETQIGTLVTAINGTGSFTAARDTTGADPVIDNTASVGAAAAGTNVANTFNTGSDANTLTVRIQPGFSTASNIVAAINSTGTFSARLDSTEAANSGFGTVVDSLADAGTAAVTSGGSGTDLDRTSGIRIVNGNQTYTITFENAETIDDLLNKINHSDAGVLAEINPDGNGIQVRSTLSGSELYIGENGGTTASQLGIRTLTGDTALANLNGGKGVRTNTGSDFSITRRDGVVIPVDLDGGTYATASINGAGANDGLTFSRLTPGVAGNSFSIRIVDSGLGGGDSVALSGNTLTYSVDIAAGFTANEAVALLAGDSVLSQQFAARLDTGADPSNNGSSNLAATGPVSFTGGKASALTINDVLNVINNAPANITGGSTLQARLAHVGNGIELVDSSPGGGTLTVAGSPAIATALDLGLIPNGQITSVSPTTSGGNQIITGGDNNPTEVRSLFTAILRLKRAIAAGDNPAIQDNIALLDSLGDQVTAVRAELGVRAQSIDTLDVQLQDETVELDKVRSSNLEVDITEAISQLLARQAAFEAALRAAASIGQLSLLNFL